MKITPRSVPWLAFWSLGISTVQAITVINSATLTVTADSIEPCAYQWFKDGAPISGARSPNLSINPFTTDSRGFYRVLVSNFMGSIYSENIALTLAKDPIPVQSAPIAIKQTFGTKLRKVISYFFFQK